MTESLPPALTVEAVKQLMDEQAVFTLLDCRQPEEHALAHLPGAVLIPMNELEQRVAELEAHRDDRMVVYCHHGMRSEMVVQWLRARGFPLAQNMTGGIDAWSALIDTTVPRY